MIRFFMASNRIIRMEIYREPCGTVIREEWLVPGWLSDDCLCTRPVVQYVYICVCVSLCMCFSVYVFLCVCVCVCYVCVCIPGWLLDDCLCTHPTV